MCFTDNKSLQLLVEHSIACCGKIQSVTIGISYLKVVLLIT